MDIKVLKKPYILLWIIILIGCIRIISTYTHLSHTNDEPFHVYCGLEFLQDSKYNVEALHPPLSRVAVAYGLYREGARIVNDTTKQNSDGIIEPYSTNNKYWHNITLSRLGILPFFVIAVLCMYWLGSMLCGANTGLLSAGIYSFIPMVLAHSGLATTDIPASAMLLLSLSSLLFAYRKNTWWSWLIVGIALGLAISSKFTMIPFGVLLLISVLIYGRKLKKQGNKLRIPHMRFIALSVVTSCIVVWGVYGFSFGTIGDYRDRYGGYNPTNEVLEEHLQGSNVIKPIVLTLSNIPVPAPAFFVGIMEVYDRNNKSDGGYFLGNPSAPREILWLFFPVLYLAKMPLGFLVLFLMSIIAVKKIKIGNSLSVILLWFVLCVAFMLTSKLIIGLRHVLPILFLPPLLTAVGIEYYTRTKSKIHLLIIGGGIALFAIESIVAHPYYLTWFNVVANPYKTTITRDSDVDWGQDEKATVDTLQKYNLSKAYIVAPFPPSVWKIDSTKYVFNNIMNIKLDDSYRYIAVGYNYLFIDPQFKKLLGEKPLYKIGTSMSIYKNPLFKSDSVP